MSSQTILCGTWAFCANPIQRVSRKCTTSLSDMVIDAIEEVELNPNQPTVGAPGSVPNRDGVFELDAAIMSSKLGCGAVLGLRNFKGAIRAAQKVALFSPHSILVGEGAESFTERCAVDDGLLKRLRMTPEEQKTKEERKQFAGIQPDDENIDGHSDTLGVIGIRRRTPLADDERYDVEIIAAVASSGLGRKDPGRVGDSALFGSGLYSDSAAGACVATGDGDVIALFPLSFLVCQLMLLHPAKTVDAVCELALGSFFASPNVQQFLKQRDVKNKVSPDGPMVAICAARASDGQVGRACNKSWRNEFVYSHISFFDGDEAGDPAERKVEVKGFVEDH